MQRAIAFAKLFGLSLVAFGCSPGFEPPSVISGLRVLAVRPEPGSGTPGETVTLEMLVADGAREPGEPPRPLEFAWFGGCHNPPSRLYFDCFPVISAIAGELPERLVETPPDSLPPGAFGIGTTFALPLPDDILSSAPKLETDPVHFGISYAFFAACAGVLEPRPQRTDRVPVACVSPESGAELGAEDFVQGFAMVPTFEGVINQNPLITAVRFGSLTLEERACQVDADCDGTGGAAPGNFGCSPLEKCAPIAKPCKGDDCPKILVDPEIDRASAEPLPGDDAREIVWAKYYTTAGTFQTDAQLVNDRTTGFVEEHGAYFYPPDHPSTTRVFVTVNDQRGGAAWRSFEVLVRN